MGEDSCRTMPPVERKYNALNGEMNFPRQQHSVSSCSEADSESTTCLGDATQEEEETDQDYQYGPGIVSKLRTKFLSISMKQNRGLHSSMRRSCSLENILDQKSFPDNHQKRFVQTTSSEPSPTCPWNNLKRAKSMDTLLLALGGPVNDPSEIDSEKTEGCGKGPSAREPKLIKRKDGPLNRPTVTICDEELPKPDTVKTYKRMFEPAESKKASMNSNVRRRPPVLRATAKSSSLVNSKQGSPTTNNKVNGALPQSPPSTFLKNACPKSKPSAKATAKKDTAPLNATQKPCLKVQQDSTNGDDHVTAMNKKNLAETPSPTPSDLIPNGIATNTDSAPAKPKEGGLKRNLRAPKYLEGMDPKPAVPLHKPQTKKGGNVLKPNALPSVQKTDDKASPLKSEEKADKLEVPLPKKPADTISKRIPNSSPKVAERLKPEHARNGVQPEEEPRTYKAVQLELKKLPKPEVPAIQDSGNDIECNKTLTNGYDRPDVVPLELEEKNTVVASPTNNALTNGEAKDCKKVVVNGNLTGSANSMVFDFRGKDVVAHLAVQPAPFGCKAAIAPNKKRPVIIDGKESVPYLNGFANGGDSDDFEDEEYVDYSVPPPCGLVFEGENVRVGKGALLSTRNKDLKIHFNEDTEKSTFIYPSESSFLTDDSDLSSLETADCSSTVSASSSSSTTKLKTLPSISSNGTSGLMSYTPSVLRTVDNLQPGMFRAPHDKDDKKKAAKKSEGGENEPAPSSVDGEQENRNEQAQNGEGSDEDDGAMLKPADPEFISSWSLSANTSDLLF